MEQAVTATPRDRVGARAFDGRRGGRRRFRPIILWLVPILGHIFLFSLIPIAAAFVLSLHDYRVNQPSTFTGFENYIYALTRDQVFLESLRNTFYYAFVSVPLGMIIALAVAQLIHSRRHLKPLFRTVYFLPVITPILAVTVVWRLILGNSQFGLLNGLLLGMGVPPQRWLDSSALVIPSLILVGIWSGLGYNVVLFLAGLVGIPTELYEAARIDGANSWKLFWRITWPLLAPTVLFVTVVGSIGALQVFTVPYVMTRGGPEFSSTMVVMRIHAAAFTEYRMGYGASLAFIFFVIILLLTFVEIRYLRTRWSY